MRKYQIYICNNFCVMINHNKISPQYCFTTSGSTAENTVMWVEHLKLCTDVVTGPKLITVHINDNFNKEMTDQ